MMQFLYDEKNSTSRHREIYLLYYKDKLYCSGNFVVPVKLEIDRNDKSILLNNILIDSDREMCEDIFKFIILAKHILDIEGYIVNDIIASGLLYKEIYKTNIIN
jgi:hypothetical protein